MFCWLPSQEETRTLQQLMRLSPHRALLSTQHIRVSHSHNKNSVFKRAMSVANCYPNDTILDNRFICRLVFTRLLDSWSWWDVLENCWCTTALVCLCWGQQRNCCGSLTLPSQPSPGSRHGLHTPGATNLYIAKYQSDWWKQESNWAITCIFRNVCSNK